MWPEASVKLATNAKQDSYMNIYLYRSNIPEYRIATLVTFRLIFFYKKAKQTVPLKTKWFLNSVTAWQHSFDEQCN